MRFIADVNIAQKERYSERKTVSVFDNRTVVTRDKTGLEITAGKPNLLMLRLKDFALEKKVSPTIE